MPAGVCAGLLLIRLHGFRRLSPGTRGASLRSAPTGGQVVPKRPWSQHRRTDSIRRNGEAREVPSVADVARRDLAQRARLFALTRAAYGAAEGVAPWDLDDADPVAAAPGDSPGRSAPPRHRTRRRAMSPRTALALTVAVALIVTFLVVRAVVAANATTPVVPSLGATAGSPDGAGAGAPAQAPPAAAPTPESGGQGPPGSATDAAARGAQPAQASSAVVVHVAGQVASPGVVRVPAGSRVIDAVTAAGGPTSQADLDAVNLARVLVDGEQVYLPTPQESAPPAGGVSGGGAPDTPALVNLNTADATALETLPGIGPSLAERIVAWRTDHGGFTAVAELTEVSGIGPAILARLEALVTV